jgi:hypothetical protein
MKLHQISVFLENKPGQLKLTCQRLAEAKINILTLSLADSKQFGILRLITPEWERAQAVFKQANLTANITEVLAVEVADRPGGLLNILESIDEAGLNVEYMYAFTFGREGKAILVFRFDDPDAAIEKLKASGINIIGSVDLFKNRDKV